MQKFLENWRKNSLANLWLYGCYRVKQIYFFFKNFLVIYATLTKPIGSLGFAQNIKPLDCWPQIDLLYQNELSDCSCYPHKIYWCNRWNPKDLPFIQEIIFYMIFVGVWNYDIRQNFCFFLLVGWVNQILRMWYK